MLFPRLNNDTLKEKKTVLIPMYLTQALACNEVNICFNTLKEIFMLSDMLMYYNLSYLLLFSNHIILLPRSPT